MAAAPSLTSLFRIEFNVSGSTMTADFYDITDYTAIASGTVDGLIKVTAPSGVIYINPGYVADDYSSPDYTGAYNAGEAVLKKTGITLPTDADGNLEQGTYLVEAKMKCSAYPSDPYSASNSLSFAVTDPVGSLSVAHTCSTSILLSTDTTEYNTTNGVAAVVPSSTTRVHTIISPTGSGVGNIVGSTQVLQAGANIWTNMYTVTLSTTVTYQLEQAGATDTFLYNLVVTAIEYHDVQCDNCMCDVYTCIVALEARRSELFASGESNKEYLRYTRLLSEVKDNHMLYEIAESCGYDSSGWCNAIVDIVQKAGCNCCDASDTASTEVIPYASGAGSTVTVNQWLSGTGAPGAGLGDTDDFYLNDANGDVYKKVAGTWTLLLNIKGAAGAAGSSVSVLSSSISDVGTDSGTLEKDLKSYTLPVDTLDTNGDVVRVTALFRLALNSNGKTLKIYFGGDSIFTKYYSSTINTGNKDLKFIMDINRAGAASQLLDVTVLRGGQPGDVDGFVIDSKTKDLTATQEVKVTGQNAIASANDIVCKLLRVELMSKS